MKPLNSVKKIETQLNVLLRLDTDLPMKDGLVLDRSRLMKSLPTIKLLLKKHNRVVIIGHMGRPEGKFVEELSLKPVFCELKKIMEENGMADVEMTFSDKIENKNEISKELETNQIVFLENLRFWPEEDANDQKLFSALKKVCSVFVNDAFAVAHRQSASIMLHKVMKTYYGLSFVEEAKNISKVLEAKRPLTVVLGGAKKDKLSYLPYLEKIADKVLIGGKLPDYLEENYNKNKVIAASFSTNGFDISASSIEEFKKIIKTSKTIIWAGAMGFYELPENRTGTEEIAKAIANAEAFKIIAGGDTGASIANLGLKDKIDFVCSGGGVMLEFLAKGQLPAWE